MRGRHLFGTLTCTALVAIPLMGCGSEASKIAEPAKSDVATVKQASAAGTHDEKRIRFNWQMNCQGCHGAGGEGNIARDVPELVALEKFQRLPEGREFLIRVPGMSRSPLSDEDLTELANWMMGEFVSPGTAQDWQAYTVAEVSELRRRPIIDGVVEHRAKLIAKIEGAGG